MSKGMNTLNKRVRYLLDENESIRDDLNTYTDLNETLEAENRELRDKYESEEDEFEYDDDEYFGEDGFDGDD
jgi:regulator of replication initiation timing